MSFIFCSKIVRYNIVTTSSRISEDLSLALCYLGYLTTYFYVFEFLSKWKRLGSHLFFIFSDLDYFCNFTASDFLTPDSPNLDSCFILRGKTIHYSDRDILHNCVGRVACEGGGRLMSPDAAWLVCEVGWIGRHEVGLHAVLELDFVLGRRRESLVHVVSYNTPNGTEKQRCSITRGATEYLQVKTLCQSTTLEKSN